MTLAADRYRCSLRSARSRAADVSHARSRRARGARRTQRRRQEHLAARARRPRRARRDRDVARHAACATRRRTRARTVAYLPQDPPCIGRSPRAKSWRSGVYPHRAFGANAAPRTTPPCSPRCARPTRVEFAARSVDRLSVGERARVLLARAFAVEPRCCLSTSRSGCSTRTISSTSCARCALTPRATVSGASRV